jgi:hypothetical protein
MSMIFPNEFQLLSPMVRPAELLPNILLLDTTKMDAEFGNYDTSTVVMECQHEHPISYSVQLLPPKEEELEQDPEGGWEKAIAGERQ